MKLSVIIPTYNEERFLEDLLSQIEPRDDVEVIVVDKHSTDRTADVATEYGATVLETDEDLSAAKNLGAEHAKGEYLLFLDADQLLWSEQPMTDLLMWLRSHPVIVGTGPIYQAPGTGNLWSSLREAYRQVFPTLSGGYTLIRKDAFERLGGFRPRDQCLFWWEDVDLSWRCQAANYPIVMLPFSTIHRRGFNLRLLDGSVLLKG